MRMWPRRLFCAFSDSFASSSSGETDPPLEVIVMRRRRTLAMMQGIPMGERVE